MIQVSIKQDFCPRGGGGRYVQLNRYDECNNHVATLSPRSVKARWRKKLPEKFLEVKPPLESIQGLELTQSPNKVKLHPGKS